MKTFASFNSNHRHLALCLAITAILALTLGGTPVAAQDSPSATFQVTCMPDTFQPDEWVVVDCVTIVTSNGEDLSDGGYLSVGTKNGVIPDYYWISLTVDGRPVRVSSLDTNFEVPPLAPGQSSKSELIGLMRMSEGTWQGGDILYGDDKELAMLDLKLTASNDAPAPPSDVTITTRTLSDSGPQYPVVFETIIKNEASTPATYLKVTERSEGANVASAEPDPLAQFGGDGINWVFWDLPSFGLDSLSPGQSTAFQTEYSAFDDFSGCASLGRAILVEANTGNGIERYAVPPVEASAVIGDCGLGEGAPGADMPIAFGQGGQGPDAALSNPMWAAALLAMAGGGLVTTSMLLRRQRR